MNLSSSRYAVANSISALVVADYVREHNAVTEAKKLGIPIIALCNTNTCAPDATISIPCNTNNNSTI
jgi:ribosomal protein S2